ncbi:hypothetical protein [Streptomyces parvulus]
MPLRIDDRITLIDRRPPGRVHSLHRDIENGRPGVRYRLPCGRTLEERMRWAYLSDIATVNDRTTDYALRYPIPTSSTRSRRTNVPSSLGHRWSRSPVASTRARPWRRSCAVCPCRRSSTPAQEEDLCNGMVGIDVEMRFRMYVLPGEQDDATAVRDAFEHWLQREYGPRRHGVVAPR